MFISTLWFKNHTNSLFSIAHNIKFKTP